MSQIDAFFERYGPAYKWYATVTIMVATVAVVLSATIVNVAIPAVMGAFGISAVQAQWISTGFLAAMTATMLLADWADRAFGMRLTMNAEPPVSTAAFFQQVLTTPGGWALILLGIPVGACFAAVVLAISVVSFPLLVDRNIGLPRAVATSIEVTRKNPRTVATWGVIVAVLLALGSIPLFLGLIVVMPVLGHATWHLYRRAVSPAR